MLDLSYASHGDCARVDPGAAGAAREHPGILIVGLVFAVILMGVAANLIARYIERYRWIGYVGLLVILYVALKMIWDGYHHVAPVLGWPAVPVNA